MIESMCTIPHEEKPVIALDYDDTFSANPAAWFHAMVKLKAGGYRILGITARNREDVISNPLWHQTCEATVYCGGHAKREVAANMNIDIAVWIDDKPQYITNTYEALHGKRYDDSIPLEVCEPVMVDAFDRPEQVRPNKGQVVYDLGDNESDSGIASWLARRD